jgi:hypothetical protein
MNVYDATRTRPGMIQLIVKIPEGGISDDVIITCPNQISSDEFALIFGAVCKIMNTTIVHCAANIGLEYCHCVKRYAACFSKYIHPSIHPSIKTASN